MRTPRKALGFLVSTTGVLALLGLPAPTQGLAAPAPAPTWTVTYARELSSVAVGVTGHAYVAGSRHTQSGRSYAVLRKYGPGGSVIWTRLWNPGQAYTRGRDVAVGADGSVYLAGTVSSPHYEGGGWFIRRYSPSGRLLWHRATPGWRKGMVSETISALAVSTDMVVVSGYDHGCCGEWFMQDGWVRAYDLDGNLLWTNPFETPRFPRTYDAAKGISIDRRDRVYVAGWVATERERSESGLADHEVLVQRLDPSGRTTWSWILRNRGKDEDTATSVSASGQRVMVTAALTGASWLGRFSSDGALVWKRWDHGIAAVSAGPSGSSYVVGTERDASEGGRDAFVRRYAGNGDLTWSLTLEEGNKYLYGTHVAAGAGALYVTGYRSDDRWADPNGGYLWRFEQ